MGSSEESSMAVYAVVYKLENEEWKVLGEGWSEVHLCIDHEDDSSRVVAWTSDTHVVLLNAQLSPDCRYSRKTDDFHKFFDSHNNVYGFGFFPSDASLEQSNAFMKEMKSAIGASIPVISAAQRRASLATLTPNQHSTEKWLSKNPSAALGTLEIVAARAGRRSSCEAADVEISDPVHVKRTQHVSYDPATNRYHGLPDEWLSVLSRQFGADPQTVDGVKLDRYKSRIPRVLTIMEHHLTQGHAFDSVGIFRLAPNSEECALAKEQLQKGVFEGCNDVNVVANLIKIYFRELPTAVLSSVDPNAIETLESDHNCATVIEALPEPNKSLFLWLLDLCTAVTAKADVNKMNAKNLAIVFAPNLFNASDTNLDPFSSLLYSQRVAAFVERAIELRTKAVV